MSKYILNKPYLFIGGILGVMALSLAPGNCFPKVGFSFTDLIVHFIMYGLLAFGLWIWKKDKISGMSEKTQFLYVLGLCSFGLLIEVLQGILPIGRYFSWYDAFFNSLGAFGWYGIRKIG